MNFKKALFTYAVITLTCIAVNASEVAQIGRRNGSSTESVATAAPKTLKPITLPLSGLAWAMTSTGVAESVDRILDADYAPLYQKVSPGVKMKQLDAVLAEEKAAFRRSRTDFSRPPSSFDATPLKGEYSFQNNEFLMTFIQKNATTYFFFKNDHLWKIISERPLGGESPDGTNYQDAINKVSQDLGIGGRAITAGVNGSPEVDWRDARTHFRAIWRSNTASGFAYEDINQVASPVMNRLIR
jgi:hypothetical protein